MVIANGEMSFHLGLFSELDRMMSIFSQNEFSSCLLQAKKDYFEITGMMTEEDEEFEARMNCFNEWYLFQYKNPQTDSTPFQDYVQAQTATSPIIEALSSWRHTLFEFTKINMRRQIILYDVLNDTKLSIPVDHEKIGVVEGDLFSGRYVTHAKKPYLMRGICSYPQEVRSAIVKQAKIVRKLRDLEAEESFLLKLEHLKTKLLRYGHIQSSRIFVF